MKKIALLLIVACFVAAPAAAAPKKKMLTYEQAMEQNRKSWELVKEGLPLALPTWALPIYFSMQQNADKTHHRAKRRRQ